MPVLPPEKAQAMRVMVAMLASANLTIRDCFIDPATFTSDERVEKIRRAHHHAPPNARGNSHEAIGMLLDYIGKQMAVIEQQKKIITRQSARIRVLDNLDEL